MSLLLLSTRISTNVSFRLVQTEAQPTIRKVVKHSDVIAHMSVARSRLLPTGRWTFKSQHNAAHWSAVSSGW